MNNMEIGSHIIGNGKTFVIAEVGSNHTGSIDLAYKHIDAAVDSGADAVKFQSININKLYKNPSQTTKDLHAIIDMDESWCANLKDYADKCGIIFFSSPTYLDAVGILERIDVPLFKLASAQVGTFPQLVKTVADTGKATILSSGIVNYGQLSDAVSLFEQAGNNNYAILHCNSIYPTPADKVFLGRMDTYRKMFNCPVGYSDHTSGAAVVLAAVALGADIIEKHFLLTNDINSPDAPFSISPKEFKLMVKDIRAIESARLDSPRLELEPEEKTFKDAIRYRLVLRHKKEKGDKFLEQDFYFLRSNNGIDVSHLQLVLDNMLAADFMDKGWIIEWHNLMGG